MSLAVLDVAFRGEARRLRGDPLGRSLTSHERDVLETVARHGDMRQAGYALGLSYYTVKHHMATVNAKLGTCSALQAFWAVVRLGR